MQLSHEADQCLYGWDNAQETNLSACRAMMISLFLVSNFECTEPLYKPIRMMKVYFPFNYSFISALYPLLCHNERFESSPVSLFPRIFSPSLHLIYGRRV